MNLPERLPCSRALSLVLASLLLFAAGCPKRGGGVERKSALYPMTIPHVIVTGLVAPYTYSDMTGIGIANASGCTPPAG